MGPTTFPCLTLHFIPTEKTEVSRRRDNDGRKRTSALFEFINCRPYMISGGLGREISRGEDFFSKIQEFSVHFPAHLH